MTIKALRKIANKSIRNAGPRYTPGVDANAPNLNIQPLLSTIDFLTRAKSLSDKLAVILHQISSYQQSYNVYIKKYFRGRKKYTIPTIKICIQEYLTLRNNLDFQKLGLLRKSVEHVYEKLEQLRSDAWREHEEVKDSERQREITAKIHNLNKWTGMLSDLSEITNSKYYELINRPRLIIGGGAGCGKTHFLCDLAKGKLEKNSPAMLVLAQDIHKVMDPLAQMSEIEKFARNKKSLLKKIAKLAKNNERALIIIDGINEGDYDGWQSHYLSLCHELSEYPQIALLISARSPSDDYFVEKLPKGHLPLTKHYGFDDIEFDAVAEFFKYYKIPLPDYPLLDAELSNPLFLKLACIALQKNGSKKIKTNLSEIVSGLKTFTSLFEDYVKHCTRRIRDKLGVQPRKCWEIIKGDKISVNGAQKEVGVATLMGEMEREYIYPDEFKEIITNFTGLSGDKLGELYIEFIKSGVIVEDIRWTENKKKTLRFPYQRISDHIIARYLLRVHLADVKSCDDIKACFGEATVLGKIFTLRESGWARYEKPGLAEAIIMEFPEYTQRHVDEDKREIINFLPKKNTSLSAFSEPFLSGLIWRNKSNFTKCTDKVVSFMLNCDVPYVRKNALKVVSNLAIRKDHAYSAEHLYSYLSKLSLVERDLFWTEYLRESSFYSVRGRLMRWLSTHKIEHMDRDTSDNFQYILSLFLCTTDKDFQDIITKQIFKLGLLYPDILFAHTISAFDFNDPYVLERMLAASYGVAMHCYADKKKANLVCDFSKKIFEKIFKVDSENGTTHYIIRDYASKLVELALVIDAATFTVMQKKRATAPFPSMGVKRWGRAAPQDGYMPLEYEFRKDRISTLANNYDRYDFRNASQIEVEQKILWRINKLGYDLNKFKFIDEGIVRAQGYTRSKISVTSYGMKYALIAFYELLGWRLDRGLNSIDQFAGSQSRIDVRLDPSFPSLEQYPEFVPRKLLRASKKSLSNWVDKGGVPNFEKYLAVKDVGGVLGNSILLNGSIFRDDKNQNKRILIFMRGLLIDNVDVSNITQLLRKTNIDHINNIPDLLSYHYLYAGEIPWGAAFSADEIRNLNATKYKTVLNRDGSNTTSFSQILNVSLMLPASTYSWGETTCVANDVGSAYILSKFLIDDLRLNFKPSGMNFYDQDDKQISCIIKSQDADTFSNHHEFLYIEKNVLDQYLKKHDLTLIWIIWGERALTFEDINEIQKTTEKPVWKRFKSVRKYDF